ncbi:CHAT domain-containing protein [Hwangdonia lutea]|uniref:CHAT domain-containing protein n=1 Tax=Hwangdonia lutea TaxID=3075823 RepID=A0AA97EQB0_9FLAO|nr:CHAT domain-containing protein [Hwangdonia sp. SCSIO 19198]WOD44153.1 CHAT domain-containing protein [Hwangdonia sp. SCSIO 19198]
MCTTTLQAQNKSVFNTQYIDQLIENDSLEKAENELHIQTQYYTNNKQYDSLSNLVYYHGRIALLKGDNDFFHKSKTALEKLKSLTNNPDDIYNAYADMSTLTVDNGMYQESYDFNKLGFEQAEKSSTDRLNKMAKRAYGLSSTSYFMRKFDLVKKHGLEAFKINQSNPKATATNVYSACNIVGLMMQNENKLDSALYYYNKGFDALKNTKGSLNERYYYPAVLAGNMAIIYMNQGKFSKSLKIQENAIRNYKIYIDSSAKSSNMSNVKYNYLAIINDMGSNYVKLGQVERALNLFEYNYKKAKAYFPDNSIQQIIFINQFAQGKWVAHDGEEALRLINESYKKFKNISEDYAGYMTYAMGTKANILENMDSIAAAYDAYQLSDALFETVSPGSYSHDRLTKLRESALFYSRNGYEKEANIATNKVLEVVNKTATQEDLETIKANNLMAEVQFNLKNYNAAISWSEKSLALLEKNKALKSTDSAYWQTLKAMPLLYKSKATYKRIDTTNVKAVSDIYNTLKNSIDILNTSSSKYISNVDKSEHLSKMKPVLNFTMQISLKLYEMTKDSLYLEQLISMHESTLYSRIRSKLSIRENIQFKDVPQDILEKENTLKNTLKRLRNDINLDENSIQQFINTNNEWLIFLDDLKKKYPKYYNMRYKTIKQSLGNIQNNIPKNTTVIRYLYINSNLYAFIATEKSTALYKLNSENLEAQIQLASNNITEKDSSKKALHQLYKQLWEPFETKITTKNIIIIPDGALFNLSFECLTFKEINSFKELETNSLLSKYSISYNYSLLLVDNKKTVDYQNDFIAFAPEFNDKMKTDYKIAITDSIAIDKTYLKLIPQPFSVDLAKEFSQLFNGTSFINEKASKQIFKNEANEHKIIHIGTHAESNNITPELSRLIFAKNDDNEDNSLYTYEIYNENLNSNLAILTACETGKPTFQAGEGMISLAHAFNYAGSESILTSLWKIDEQSSAKIIELFYNNIKNGLPKDKALQQAKLDYIAQAEGRTVTPQYWAGLVLIGDVSPIALQTDSNTIFYWLFAMLGLVLLIVLVRKLKTKNKN